MLLCNDGTGTKQRKGRKSDQDSRQQMQDEAARIRWLLAINPNTPAPVLEHLARDSSFSVVERVAQHPRTHTTTLARLSTHPDVRVRAAVAENFNLTIKTIWRLARDENPDVRLALAESYTVPIAVLRVLSEDSNPYVADRAQRTMRRILSEVSTLRLS